MAILNYTTKIDAHKTIAEISAILVKHKAHRIVSDYEDGIPISISFMLSPVGCDPMFFKLPCNFNGVLGVLKKDGKVPGRLKTREQAVRVGWRIVKDWVSAQCAIIEAELAVPEEVFLPYAVMKDGKTLFEGISDVRPLLLEN